MTVFHTTTRNIKRKNGGIAMAVGKRSKPPSAKVKLKKKHDFIAAQSDTGEVCDHVIAKRATKALHMNVTPQLVSRWRNSQQPKVQSAYMVHRMVIAVEKNEISKLYASVGWTG